MEAFLAAVAFAAGAVVGLIERKMAVALACAGLFLLTLGEAINKL